MNTYDNVNVLHKIGSFYNPNTPYVEVDQPIERLVVFTEIMTNRLKFKSIISSDNTYVLTDENNDFYITSENEFYVIDIDLKL